MNPPQSPSIPDEIPCHDISIMIGKSIQVQWNMSDGSLQWFEAIVRSCSGEEAVVVYEDGDSYLLEMYGETEWRPFPRTAAAVAATEDSGMQNTDRSNCSARAISPTTNPSYNNDSMTSSFSTKTKSPLSLRSLIGKITGTSLYVPSPKKTANRAKEQALPLSSGSSFSDERISSGTTASVPELLEEEFHSSVTKDSPRKRKAQEEFGSTKNQATKRQKLPSSLAVPKKIIGLQEERVAALLQKKTLSEQSKANRQHQKLHSFRKHSFKRHSFMKRLPPLSSHRIGALTKPPVLFDPNVENEALYFY